MEITNSIRGFFTSGLGVPILVISLLAMMVIPLPPFLLDVLFTFNIVLSLMVILVAIYSPRPIDFSAFPTVLLVATLMRLGLNVASTRVVLLNGHEGDQAAGKVIEAFGNFVIGGNLVIGIIVFSILVVINFVVITKGTGRVAEVSARFTLDSLPGKQMAIDADLNSGLIDSEEAKRRREELSVETDFYGSMDGASKFVKGDAIAGILIMFINLIAGLAIGMGQHGLDASTAVHYYTLLTIGDGLAAQIPSLLLSTATAIIVTRMSKSSNLGGEILSQVSTEKVFLISGLMMLGLGVIPGMPNGIFLMFAAVLLGLFYYKKTKTKENEINKLPEEEVESPVEENMDVSWEDIPDIEPISLEIGYRLIDFVDESQDGTLTRQIRGIRKKESLELGFLVPTIHIKDNLELDPEEYVIRIMGVKMDSFKVMKGKYLAIDPGDIQEPIEGVKTKEPSYGLDAVWIDASMVDEAQAMGYTIADIPNIITTHLSKIIFDNAYNLFGRDELDKILEKIKSINSKLYDEFDGDIPLGSVMGVFQNLLKEGIPIKNYKKILEIIADNKSFANDINTLTNIVRIGISDYIIQSIVGDEDELRVIVLSPELEENLQKSIDGNGDSFAIMPQLAEKMQESLKEILEREEAQGYYPVLVVNSPNVRQFLSNLYRSTFSDLRVLSVSEIERNNKIKITISGTI